MSSFWLMCSMSSSTQASRRTTKANRDLAPEDTNLIYNSSSIPSALTFAALNEQDPPCRLFGDCRHADVLDREVGTATAHVDELRQVGEHVAAQVSAAHAAGF
jgi:hypothetical protein